MATALHPRPGGERTMPRAAVRRAFRQARLDEHLPADHRLSLVYRAGAGLMGVVLLVFGVLGLTENIGMFSTGDNTIAGLSTNGALSWLSVVVGLLLFGGMLRGGNIASSLNMLFGVLFVLSGFVNLMVLETGLNILNFRIENVLFSFVVGLLLLTFGMYGRVSGRLPHDNPYWRVRHPGEVAEEERLRAGAARRAVPLTGREEDRTAPGGAPGRRAVSPPRR